MNVLIGWSHVQDFESEIEVDDDELLAWWNDSQPRTVSTISDIPNLSSVVLAFLAAGDSHYWHDQCSATDDWVQTDHETLQGAKVLLS